MVVGETDSRQIRQCLTCGEETKQSTKQEREPGSERVALLNRGSQRPHW